MNHENRRSRRVSGEAIPDPLPTVGVTPAWGSQELSRQLLARSGRAGGRAEYDSPVEKQWRLEIDAANDITDVDNVDRHEDDIDGYENSEEKAVEKDMKLAGRRDKPGNVLVNLDVLLPFLEQNFSCKKCADKGLMSPVVIHHKAMFLDTCLTYTCTVRENGRQKAGQAQNFRSLWVDWAHTVYAENMPSARSLRRQNWRRARSSGSRRNDRYVDLGVCYLTHFTSGFDLLTFSMLYPNFVWGTCLAHLLYQI